MRVEGRIAPGEKIKVVSEANPSRAFPVTVTEFVPGRKMVWSGGMPLPDLQPSFDKFAGGLKTKAEGQR